MKVLLIAIKKTLDYTVPLLEAAGHDVRLLTHCRGIPLMLGLPECKEYVLEQITDFAPNLVINAVTTIVLPTSSEYTYLGNTEGSARLETHKWETRHNAGSLGWSLPVVLEECTMDTMSSYSNTTYLKPKEDNPFAVQVPANTTYNESFPLNTPAYVEESLDYAIGACCMFTVSNGAYHITRTLGTSVGDGDGDEKSIESDGDWTCCYTFSDLTGATLAAFLAKCVTWLDYAVTLGGNYSGIIEAGITASNEVFWFEQNSRPGTYAESFLSGTIQDWIEGLSTDPTKSPVTLYRTET